ncbi:MAG: AlkA N-terminal domain-containing protein [Acidaminobacteraceae bacterium]
MVDRNNDAYSVARKNKDGNFDGKFFFAVSTTGIVCRPSCPSPIAKEENVTYFSSLYDAINKGYRPCLRCRPDIYTEFYTSNLDGEIIISDAMKLISEGFLNSNSVSDLADYFHLSERYFRKLFVKNIGLSPTQIAKYNRAIFAKRMLINSDLAVTSIAFASGFGSIRQFNNVFKDIFKVSPSDIRLETTNDLKAGTTMLLAYNKPFDFCQVLEFMQPRMIKGIELVEKNRFTRTFNIRGIKGYFIVKDNPSKSSLELDVFCDDMSVFREIYYRVRKMFDLDTDFEKVKHSLSSDNYLKKLMGSKNVPRLPVAFNSYEFIIRAILGQQITVKAATTLAARIVERAGIKSGIDIEGLEYVFPKLEELINLPLEDLGITKTRIKTIKNVNEALTDEVFSLSVNQSHAKFYYEFTSVKGIGDWTANYVAMRGLGMVDAFPAGDLWVINALKKEYGDMKIRDIKKRSDKWRPYRAYVTLFLWQSLGEV